ILTFARYPLVFRIGHQMSFGLSLYQRLAESKLLCRGNVVFPPVYRRSVTAGAGKIHLVRIPVVTLGELESQEGALHAIVLEEHVALVRLPGERKKRISFS